MEEESGNKDVSLETENLKFLYEFQSKQYEHVKAQTVRLDDKAAKYLTFITIVMATIGIISRYYLFEISSYDFTTSLTVIFLCLAFALILNIARLLFLSLKVAEVGKLPTNIEMNKHIKESKINEVYDGLSNDLSRINESYERSLANKKKHLESAFKETSFLGIILVLLLTSIVIELLNRDVKEDKTTTTCIIDKSKQNVETATTTAKTTAKSTTYPTTTY